MEKQDKIHLLLSMQEHPEQYTDEQLLQMLADDPELAEQLEQLALTKQTFVKHEADEEAVPVEDEWQKFAAEHAEELKALGKDEPHTATIKKLMGILLIRWQQASSAYSLQQESHSPPSILCVWLAIPSHRLFRQNKPYLTSLSLLCQLTPSRRTRQPRQSPLFSIMWHWI